MMIAVMGLAACGGGGGGNDNPPPSGPSTQPPPPPPPANTAPTVTAGDDQTIKLPTNSVSLTGSAQDAENNTLTYAWTSSPADGVTFADAAAAATQATFTTAGTYTLTLTANDGTTTGNDTVAVTVQAADAPPPPPPVEIAWPGVDPNDPVADPNHGWVAVAAASDVGMDAAIFADAVTYARNAGGAGMITRHGKLVAKWDDPGTPSPDGVSPPIHAPVSIDSKVDVKSTTKSIGGIALALALADKTLGLGDTAVTHLPAIASAPTNTPGEPSLVTIQQLATHTAGFEKAVNNLAYGPPGEQWEYSDVGLNWLADVLTTRFGNDLRLVLRDRVWAPIGITSDDVTWANGAIKNPATPTIQYRTLASGISTNVNAMARIGLLYLRKGKWQDQQLIPEEFVTMASTPREETKSAVVRPEQAARFPNANLNYGLLWWTNASDQLKGVPTDAYWAWGLGDSLIVVIPSLDIVISRVGRNPDQAGPHWRKKGDGSADWNGDYSVLGPFLLPIVQSVTDPAR